MFRHQAALASPLHELLNVFLQRHGIVVFSLFRAEQTCYVPPSGLSYQCLNLLTVTVELCRVFLFELLPSARIVLEPFPQRGAGRDFPQPFINARLAFLQPSRPESIDQHAIAIGLRRLIVNAFDSNTHAWLSRSEEHTSELQSRRDLVCRLLLEKKKKK